MTRQQVGSYVEGFGEFNVHDPESFSDVSNEQLMCLYTELSYSGFYCEGCDSHFNPYQDNERRNVIFKKLIIPE